jgi:putative ABC transport system substrate-binding protein
MRTIVSPRRRALVAACAALLATGARAQPRVARIGYLSTRASHSSIDDAFIAGLRELGREVGRDVVIEYRWAGNDMARLPRLAEDLVRLDVDVIVTATTAGTRAAMQATRTIPIVMAATADPVAAGLVASLARPGGNVTGISLRTTDIASKRLQIARELVPGATRVALLAESVAGPQQGTTALLVAETAGAARAMGAELIVREVASAGALAEAFASFRRERAQALIVQVSPLLVEHGARVAELAAQSRLPAIYEARNFVEAGGLVAYRPDLRDGYRRAAAYVDRILKGSKPGDIPVEQPDRYALVINLKAAQALGLAIPASLRLQADELVE